MSQLTVQFFASLREQLGHDKIEVNWPDSAPLSSLVDRIEQQLGKAASEVLSQDNILVAVNQTMVERSHIVAPGDEVAFLPPVTGG